MFPLSFAQEGLWLADRLGGGDAAYNVPAAVRLFGRLDVTALSRAIDGVVRRHEALRTAIVQTPDGLRQVVVAELSMPLAVTDLSAARPAERETEARRTLRMEARRPFDLAHAPLARWVVVRLGPDEHIVQLVAHHIICDAWSLAIIIREAGQRYASAAGEPRVQELPLQYADYAVWQRRRAGSAEWTRQREYWRQQLTGITPLNLSGDRPQVTAPTTAGAVVRFTVDGDTLDPLRLLARATGATLFMTLLAGFKTVLAAYTAQTDIAVGTPVVDRPRPELESLVGLFLNTIVLRTDLSGSPSFREGVERVRDVALQAFANRDIPFEQVVEAVRPHRSTNRNPLFEVLFTLQNAPHEEVAFGELTSRREEVATDTVKFDLSLFLYEHADHLSGVLEYRTDLFEPCTAERLVAYFRRALHEGARNPDRGIGMLALDEAEAAEVIQRWNQTERPLVGPFTVQDRVTRTAAGQPNALALVCEDARFTFHAVEEQANRLARYLRRFGVRPGARVGVCLERQPALPIAILAVLKAGAAFVPLDPAYPPARLADIMSDSGVSAVVTSTPLAERLGIAARHGIVCVDRDEEVIATEPTAPLESTAHPLDIAYIVYTSGSTGRPKGVALPHAALANLIEWYGAVMHRGPALQFASVGFDASFLELFGPWSAGDPVYVPPESVRTDPDALVRYIGRHGIEKLFLPVMVLQRIAEVLDGREALFARVREIITAGEQMRITPAVVRLMARLACCRLHNYYGPSETHNATSFLLEGPPEGWSATPPVGYPIWNTRCYVLNREGQPVPRGAVGDLFIGGAGLARGYWNAPDLTAERFVPDSFGGHGGRLYRTGDLVRRLSTGALQFIGRADRQIKLRGCRVEPSEVEALLLQDPEIREAAVKVDNGLADARLVGFVVPRHPSGFASGDVRNRLRAQVPEYMVPSAFVVLEELPLNQNGKVSYVALTLPPRDAGNALPARDAVEGVIASAWGEVLRRDVIGVDDNVFDLGAHSLSVAQMANRLSQWFAADIAISEVFRSPTVAALAQLVTVRVGRESALEIAEGLLRSTATAR